MKKRLESLGKSTTLTKAAQIVLSRGVAQAAGHGPD